MNYYFGDLNCPTFEVGESSNSKRKRKAKTPNVRGLTFTIFEGIFLVKAWLVTSMDPICGTEQKESVELHHINTTHNMPTLQHIWSTIQDNVNNLSATMLPCLARIKVGLESKVT